MEEVFTIDIDGDEVENEDKIKKPDYNVDHFMISNSVEVKPVEVDEVGKTPDKCWNCDKIGHSQRECPLPQNRMKINKAFKSFTKATSASKRYHDNKFAKFRPGHISSQLREALGIKDNELPTHIYRMRIMGYPPGWLSEARITNSGIKMYNDRGKRMPQPEQEEGEILNKVMKYDIDKIIEFPGFNIPSAKHVIDSCRALGFPPMKSVHKLKNFIDYLEEISSKSEDMSEDSTDDEVVDMELSEMENGEIIEEVQLINNRIKEITKNRLPSGDSRSSFSTDSLEEGEIVIKKYLKKNEKSLLSGFKRRLIKGETKSSDSDKESNNSNNFKKYKCEELEDGELEDDLEEDDSANSGKNEFSEEVQGTNTQEEATLLHYDLEKCVTSENTSVNSKITPHKGNSEKPSDKILDKSDSSGTVTDIVIKRSLPINIKSISEDNSLISTPSPHGSVTSTSFSTPNLKAHSPYAKLPSFDNFNKDISDVIGFENLPDSVGKYDTMCSIISRIRSYMTSKTNKSEGTSNEK